MSIVSEHVSIPVPGFPNISYDIIRAARSDDWLRLGTITTILPDDWDPRLANARDGEWVEIIRLAHEPVEYDGYTVPAFEGDLERIEWNKRSRY